MVADRLDRSFGIDLPKEDRCRDPFEDLVVGISHDHRIVVAEPAEQLTVHGRQ